MQHIQLVHLYNEKNSTSFDCVANLYSLSEGKPAVARTQHPGHRQLFTFDVGQFFLF